MKLGFILFLIVIGLGCRGQKGEIYQQETDLAFTPLSDQCYYSTRSEKQLGGLWHEAFDIEIHKAILVYKSFKYDELINTPYLQETDSTYIVQFKTNYTTYSRNYRCDEDSLFKIDNKDYFYFSVIEFPAISEGVKKERIDLSKHMFQVQILETPSSIKRVYAKNNTSSQEPEFKAGYWSEIHSTKLRNTSRPNPDFINRVEKKLKELGYDIKLDGQLGSDDKNALSKFQKKHNLPIGQLNLETLKQLGLN